MPTAVAAIMICQPTDEKKRKEATASNNDERTVPQKKKYRYECSADGCSNKVQKGGVCVRHGAKVEYKQCSFDGCTKFAVKGGVCVRHGAKVKRCSVAGCPNQVQRKGVCRRHGAYSDGTPRANIQVENNLGRDDGNTVSATGICNDDAGGTQPQGVDRKGKAAEKQSNKLTSNDSVGEEGLFKRHGANGGDRRYQQQNNHSFPSSLINVNAEQQQHGDGNQQPTPNERINMNIAGFKSNSEIIRELKSKLSCSRRRGAMEYHGAYVKLCSVEGCATMAICGEFCWMHRSYAAEPLAQANVQPGHIQGGGNQNNLSTTVEILSDDDDGEKKQSPIARRKQEVVSGKQQSGTSTFNDAEDKEPGESDQEITGNKDTVEDRKMDGSVKSLVKRRANLKDDEEEDTLGMMPRKRTRGEHVILFDRL